METIQTRTEHSRSLEDAETFKALETLKELGLLVPVSDIETYHGRVGRESEASWSVDPSFANGSNDSGNNNVNQRSTLYAAEQEVAEDFAMERAREEIRPKYYGAFEDRVANYTPEERQEWLDRENKRHQERYDGIDPAQRQWYKHLFDENGTLKPKTLDDLMDRLEARRLEREAPEDEKSALWKSAAEGLRAEVHEIVTADSDAVVLDLAFDDSKLSDEDKERYWGALKGLIKSAPLTEGSPVDFDDRATARPLYEELFELRKYPIYEDDAAQTAESVGTSRKLALEIAGAINAMNVARIRPQALANKLLRRRGDITMEEFSDDDGNKMMAPINLEWVQRYFRNAHIVGIKQNVDSATIARNINAVSFFDLEKTTTKHDLETERAATWQQLGGMATAFAERTSSDYIEHQPRLLHLLTDAHAKPSQLVEAAKAVDGYMAIFDADAGNWEGYTLAEHTETVLRNFEENYADKVPVALLAPMRLAILAHDIGKPIAVASGEKHRKKEYNARQAGDFLTKLGIDATEKEVLLAIIGDGAELAFKIDVQKRGERAEAALHQLAEDTLRTFNGSGDAPETQIEGFVAMCKMLQICDGGAYTSMATTRSTKHNTRYRNAPSFNASFKQPVGLGKRDIKLRGDGDKPAAPHLNPSI